MNRVEFSARKYKDYKKFPVLEMNVIDDHSNIVDSCYIMLDDRCDEIVAFSPSQCPQGHSPLSGIFNHKVIGTMDKKDACNVILGQLMLCIADHLFIIDDLLHIEVKIPNIGGRCNKPAVSSFVDAVYDAVKYR